MSGAVIQYLFDKGIENVADFSDEDIAEIPGNGLMTASFCQTLVRTAKEIAQNCDLYEDIYPFIMHQLPNNYCQTQEIGLIRSDYREEEWQEITENLANILWEEVDDLDEINGLTLTVAVSEVSRR